MKITNIRNLILLLLLLCTSGVEGSLLVPHPQVMEKTQGLFRFSKNTRVVTNFKGRDFRTVAALIDGLKRNALIDGQGSTINLMLKKNSKTLTAQEREAYEMVIAPHQIDISAATTTGLFYAVQSLRQMEEGGTVPCGAIKDAPRYGYRGFMIDCSRHFWSVEFIKKQIDAMAYLKLNKLHLHLTDGGGWRLQIDRYPQLVQQTAYRPQSDWDLWTDGGRKYCSKDEPGAYGGYYTKKDMRDIIDYAAQHHIEVIPEIEMPGHSNEVLAVFPELSCTGKGDGFDLCMGNNKTFEFLTNVLKEVIDLFPSKYIHIGGDEATMRYWKTCPKCIKLYNEQHYTDTFQLQAHLINRIDSFVSKNGKKIIGWDEILEHTHLSDNATVMSWRGNSGAVKAAKAGKHAIVTPSKYYYLDHFQGSPTSEPKAIGGFSPLERVYDYEPMSVELQDSDAAQLIDGVQGNLWTEYIGTEEYAEYMIYPRLLAIAESGWGRKTSYNDFLKRTERQLDKLEKRGYNYRRITEKEEKDLELTVLQWNIWQEGTLIPGGFDAIVSEIVRLSPDFVTLSEVRNYGSDFTKRLCQALQAKGQTYHSFYTIDSGLLSKYPLTDSVVVFGENKDHGSVYKLTTEIGSQKVSVYTCHLDYLDCAYYHVRGYDGSTWKETERPKTVAELLKLNDLSWRDNAIQCFLNEARHDIENGHLVILGGDFNEPSHKDWTERTKNLYDRHGFVVPWTVSKMLEKGGFDDAYRVVFPDEAANPGFTYPCYNPAADMEKLTWAPKADERERIDCIYYKGNNFFAIDAKLFGPNRSVARSEAVADNVNDPVILPQGIWPTDHKGLWVKFRLKQK